MLTVAKQALTLAVGIGIAAPGLAPPIAPPIQRMSGDGEATAAACAPLGFDLRQRDRDSVAGIVVTSSRVNAPPPPPSLQVRPPVTLPIEPTRKEDRVEYRAPPPPPIPAPPPPPAPPAAMRPGKVNRILMFTDGDFNVGVTDDKRLEDYVAEKRGTGIYLSVYGFGRGNYQDARMQAISQAGNGTAAYVSDLNEARRLFGPAFDKGAFPIADDVKIQVEFNPARVSEYRLIGYETRLLNEEDFDNDAIDAGEVGSGASVTALYEITPVGAPSQVPERRYAGNRIETGGGDPDGEVGFVQIRYKRPGEENSRLMQKVIANPGGGGRVSTQPPESTRWALAVAAFGQKLRADPWMASGYDWSSVVEQAQGARGDDPYGERAAFVQMARAAQGLPARGIP